MDDTQKSSKLSSSYVDLSKLCKTNEYGGAIKACNRILHLDPNDSCAFTVKIVCQIQLGSFTEALDLINKNSKFYSDDLNFYKAYCLYRNHELKSAEDALKKIKANSDDKIMLLTQVFYRMDRFLEAHNTYKDIYENFSEDDKVESDCNMVAILACIKSNGLFTSDLLNVDLDYTYELKYNKACTLIALGNLSEALELLESSEAQAVETLEEEGYSLEEINNEKGIIVAQKGFVCQKLGVESDAIKWYNQVLREKPSDETLIAVVSNNLLCITKDKNVFLGKKRIKAMSLETVDWKINAAQRSRFALNQCLFFYHTQQTERCKEACENLLTNFSRLTASAVKIKSGLALKSEGFEAAKKVIDEFLEEQPKLKTKMYLALVQQLLRENKKKEATTMLKSLGNDSFRLGVVSALVTVYQAAGKTEEACEILNKAIAYYKKSGNQDKTMKLLWRQSVQLMIADGNHEAAVKSLEKLRESSPNDPATLAQLIIAYSKYDATKAEKLSRLLPPVSNPTDFDIEVLDSPNWLTSIKLLKKTTANSPPSTPLEVTKTVTNAVEKKKSKKKKKNKIPVNYDASKTPDPERWLPRYERSGFKPKKVRKGKIDVGKGTQGASTEASAIYDMSSKVNLKSVSPMEESPASSGTSWKKDGGKKKRKKRS